MKDAAVSEAAEDLYTKLKDLGVETLLDDRDERPGSKFKDADLLGIPFRIMIGKRFSKEGVVEVRRRSDGITEEMRLENLPGILQARIADELSGY